MKLITALDRLGAVSAGSQSEFKFTTLYLLCVSSIQVYKPRSNNEAHAFLLSPDVAASSLPISQSFFSLYSRYS
jgi:hypothetical protein